MIRREFLRRGALWVAAGAITPAALDRLDWAAHRLHALGPLYRARVTFYVEMRADGTYQIADVLWRVEEPRTLDGMTIDWPDPNRTGRPVLHVPAALVAGSAVTVRFGTGSSLWQRTDGV